MKKGKIVQVMGPVVDVEFEDDDLPYIKDALEVDNNGQKCIMEVSQHIGNHTVIWKLLLPAAVSKFLSANRPLAVFSMSQVKPLMAAKN